MSKRYNVIRNYKFFKSQYKYFVIFIKCGEYYYTFDSNAKIMMYLTNNYNKLKLVLDKITNYLKTLKLELNDKTVIHSCREGFDFVGYRFIYKN